MLFDVEAVWPTAFYPCCAGTVWKASIGLIHQAVLLSLKI